ncbi:thioesterase [Pseudoalteromonas sp. A22]|uniref:thioesterase II family protein n=1 Tax=Pseudoalteromonas sp. A22 TaxID=327511 RepID=UPI001BA6E837|nr:thioesterase [Pseudoalteromonas sp. A22]QUI61531.1 thioesterase [Pseudoalteromonas sp. A22]
MDYKTSKKPAAKVKLICFPYAGGGTHVFIPWQQLLHPHIELCIVQPPGRGSNFELAPFAEMTQLVDALKPELSSDLNGNYAVFGHSLGSRVALEVVRRAIHLGYRKPQHFVAPGSPGPKLPCLDKDCTSLNDAQFIQVIKELNGTPPEVLGNMELLELFLPTLRSDFYLAEQHKCEQSSLIAEHMTILSGKKDTITSAQLDSWHQFAVHSEIVLCEGVHFFIHSHSEQTVQVINLKLQNTGAL